MNIIACLVKKVQKYFYVKRFHWYCSFPPVPLREGSREHGDVFFDNERAERPPPLVRRGRQEHHQSGGGDQQGQTWIQINFIFNFFLNFLFMFSITVVVCLFKLTFKFELTELNKFIQIFF